MRAAFFAADDSLCGRVVPLALAASGAVRKPSVMPEMKARSIIRSPDPPAAAPYYFGPSSIMAAEMTNHTIIAARTSSMS